MKKKLNVLLTLLLVVVLMFALVACTGPTGPAGESITGPKGDTGDTGDTGAKGEKGDPGDGTGGEVATKVGYDYYVDQFGVSVNNVFETFVFNDLYYVLEKTTPAASTDGMQAEGDYLILFAGAWDEAAQSVMSYINEVALANDISTIYVFDPMLDGNQTVERGIITGNTTDGRFGYSVGSTNFYYDNFHINDAKFSADKTALDFLNGWVAGSTKFTAGTDKMAGPVLACVNRPADGSNATIKSIASLGATVAEIFANKSEVNSMIDEVIGSVENEGEFDAFVMNNNGRTTNGAFETYMTENKFIQEVSYAELLALMDTPGDHMIFFGGIWCRNTASLTVGVQDAAIASDFDSVIYFFDPYLARWSADTGVANATYSMRFDDIAPGASVVNGTTTGLSYAGNHARLYSYMLDEYMEGYASTWNLNESVTQAYFGASGTTSTYPINGTNYPKMCVPNVFIYNNDVAYVANESIQGIVDSHESELEYYSSGAATNKNGTQNIPDNYTRNAYKMMSGTLDLLFAKYGLVETLVDSGYTVLTKFNGFEWTLTGTKGASSIEMKTFFTPDPDDALAATTIAKATYLTANPTAKTVGKFLIK